MEQFIVEFYETKEGQRPAEEFLDMQKTPRNEIERAKRYRKDFMERAGE